MQQKIYRIYADYSVSQTPIIFFFERWSCKMTFTSILFQKNDAAVNMESQEAPSYFKDLNLDQIIDTITSGMQKYNIKSFFLQPLRSEDTISYHQEVMQDLENETLFKKIRTFSEYIYDIAIEMQKI